MPEIRTLSEKKPLAISNQDQFPPIRRCYETTHVTLISLFYLPDNGIIPKTLAGLNTDGKEGILGDPDVHVAKWVDYSSKYGLGYLLSDGTSGVVFNDSTRITMHPNG